MGCLLGCDVGCPVGPEGAAVGADVGSPGGGIDILEPPSKETAAIASPRPTMLDDVPYVIDTCARMVPTKLLDPPIVALVPTDQYTFLANAPFCRIKEVAPAVIMVVEVWKIHCGSALFKPFKVSVAADIVSWPDAEQ